MAQNALGTTVIHDLCGLIARDRRRTVVPERDPTLGVDEVHAVLDGLENGHVQVFLHAHSLRLPLHR